MNMNTPAQIAYESFRVGSQGFCSFLEARGGMDISRTEIARIARGAPDAAAFDRTWKNESWWLDDA